MKLLAVHMLRMQCPTPSFDSALAVRNAFSSCLTPIISSVLNSSNLWYFITVGIRSVHIVGRDVLNSIRSVHIVGRDVLNSFNYTSTYLRKQV